jgi:hypothetical protein
VVGRRWSQAEGGAPRAPNNGGAATFWTRARGGRCCPFIGGRRWRGGARTSRHPKAAVWAQDGVDVRPNTTKAPLGERRGRRGRWARDAWSRGIGSGRRFGEGDPTAHGPAGSSPPRRPGPAEPRRGDARHRRGRALWRPGTKLFELAHFDQVLLEILQLKYHKQSIPKL